MFEKRLGLFGNAKYSRPVFKTTSSAIVKGVEKDIALLVRPEPSRNVRKWANAPRASGDAESSMASSVTNGNVRRSLFRQQSSQQHQQQRQQRQRVNAVVVGTRYTRKFDYSPSPAVCNNNIKRNDINNNNNVLFADESQFIGEEEHERQLAELLSDSSPNAKRRRVESPPVHMPTIPPMENIAVNVLSACPRLTIRDSETARYGEQVFSLAQNSLIGRTSTRAYENGTTPSDGASKSAEIANNIDKNDLFKTMCNNTAVFDDDDSDGFDNVDEVLQSESPTRIFDVSNLFKTMYNNSVALDEDEPNDSDSFDNEMPQTESSPTHIFDVSNVFQTPETFLDNLTFDFGNATADY